MPRFVFEIEGTPVPKQRARVTWDRAYTPQQTKDWEAYVATMAKQAGVQMAPKGTTVRLDLDFRMPIPQSWRSARKLLAAYTFHTQKPDLSNLVKAIEDALIGIAYQDDGQVAAGLNEKRWWPVAPGGVEVSVEW